MTTIPLTVAKSPVFVRSLAARYGVLGCGLMIVYFLLVNALGLQGSAVARFASHAFTVLAVFLAIRAYKAPVRGPVPYLPGLALGVLVGLMGSALYAGFLLLYAYVLHPAYADELHRQLYFEIDLHPAMLAMTIMVLGGVIGGLTGYALMMSNGPDAHAGHGESTGN